MWRVLLGCFGLSGASSVWAELPVEATAGLSSIADDAVGLLNLAWPLMLAVVGPLILLRVLRDVVERATGVGSFDDVYEQTEPYDNFDAEDGFDGRDG